jgi:hypothetical protein
MNLKLKSLTTALAAAALLAPTAVAQKPAGTPGKGKPERSESARGHAKAKGQEKARGQAKGQEKARGQAKGQERARGQAKPKQAVFRGTVAAVDAEAATVTVEVTGGNKRARNLAQGQTVVFDVSKVRKLHVADRDGSGTKDLGDFAAGDRVQVQALVGSALEEVVVARKVHNKTARPAAGVEGDGTEDASQGEGENEGEGEGEGQNEGEGESEGEGGDQG